MKNDWKSYVGGMIGDQTIVAMAGKRNRAIFWIVRCSCGTERPVQASKIVKGLQGQCLQCQSRGQTGSKHPHWRGGKHVPASHYHKFERSAQRRKIEWAITIDDIDDLYERQRGLCALTETPLSFDHGQRNGVENGNASLDRIDSKIGYISGNIQLVTKQINIAKQSWNNQQFREICMAVVNACL